jgi:hypothetical protein
MKGYYPFDFLGKDDLSTRLVGYLDGFIFSKRNAKKADDKEATKKKLG